MTKEERKIYNIEYRAKNKESIIKYRKDYRKNNIDKIKEYHTQYKIDNKDILKKYRDDNKEYQKLYHSYYNEVNKDKTKKYRKSKIEYFRKYYREYDKRRKKIDPLFKLSCYTRTAIYKSLKDKGYSKKTKTYQILGCSFEELKIYLESKFEPWMTWDNQGKYNGEFNYGWDLDHIIPLSSAKTEEGIYKLNHFSNLQPLCSKINRDIKFDKI